MNIYLYMRISSKKQKNNTSFANQFEFKLVSFREIEEKARVETRNRVLVVA